MIYDIVFTLACIGLLATMVTVVLWIIKRLFHWHKIDWLKGKYVGFIFLVAIILTFVAPATQTKAQRAAQARQDRADAVSESRDKSESKRAASESSAKVESSKKASESRDKAKKNSASKKASSVKKASERRASSESKKKASAKAVSVSKAKSVSESKSKASKKAKAKKSNSGSSFWKKYKYVSLEKLTENPYKYDAGLVKTTGNVAFIQRNRDDSTMYYVVIAPKDSYSSSGYSDGHGSVTEIDIDTMKEHSIHEGDKITVYGSVMEDTVKLNGKSLKTDIIVDRVSK